MDLKQTNLILKELSPIVENALDSNVIIKGTQKVGSEVTISGKGGRK